MNNITSFPLSALRESPFNPRKTFDEAALQELAESIKSQGVMQPIVVRPLGDLQADIEHRYEIVFGHRRFRAAALAGLEQVPAILREMSDEDAAVAQVHENLQRRDVTAMEEADSFMHLARAHGMKPDDIAKAVGKSRSYVYGRMKLGRAAPEVRKACAEEGLSPETALEISRLPHHDVQRKALKEMRSTWTDGTSKAAWLSTREASRRMENMFTVRLDRAPFDRADATLAVGAGACTTCGKCAANDPALEALPADSCLDKHCFDTKVQQHNLRLVQANKARLEAHRLMGGKVLEGAEARAAYPFYSDFTPVTEEVDEDTDFGSFAQVLADMGDQAPKTVLILNPHDETMLSEWIADADIAAVLRHLGLKVEDEPEHGSDDGPTPSTAARGAGGVWSGEPARQLTLEERAAKTNWGSVLAAIMQSILRGQRTTDELRMAIMVHAEAMDDLPFPVIEAMQWEEASEGWRYGDDLAHLKEQLPTMNADQLGALLVMLAVCEQPDQSVEGRLALAARYGVDVLEACGLKDQALDAGPAGGESAQGDLLDDLTPAAEEVATPAAKKPSKTAVKYRNEHTGETWSGRGLMPKWLKVAVVNGAALQDFEVGAAKAEEVAA